MNRLALPPTDMLIGHHVLIGTSMGMGCFCRNNALAPLIPPLRAVWLTLTPRRAGTSGAKTARRAFRPVMTGKKKHLLVHTSTLAESAFFSMKLRRGSTSSPIRSPNRLLASSTSLIVTFISERALTSSVVSHSCSGFISPKPL